VLITGFVESCLVTSANYGIRGELFSNCRRNRSEHINETVCPSVAGKLHKILSILPRL
jgi:hypothetical protein